MFGVFSVITEVRKVLHDFYITRPEIIVCPILPILSVLLFGVEIHYQRVKESKEMITFSPTFLLRGEIISLCTQND